MSFDFRKGSQHNTECYQVSINKHTLGISYSTVIAYWGPLGACRRHNEWGPTSGRHFRYLDAQHLKEVSEAEMEAIIRKATKPSTPIKHVTQKFRKRILTRALSSLALHTMTSADGVMVTV